MTVVTGEITKYSRGKQEGPGNCRLTQNLAVCSYSDKAKEMTLRCLVWLEVRKLETHPLLLVPGCPGLNVKASNRVAVVESTISYVDTIDFPATDPEVKTVYKGLSRGWMQLNAVVFVLDQPFYAKAMEVYWKLLETQGAIRRRL